jgi:hypothetical protein
LLPHRLNRRRRFQRLAALWQVVSIAYLEEDGLLLSIALLTALVVVAAAMMAVGEMVIGAKWIIALW